MMSRPVLALLPSPLLGPATWAAVGRLLADRGWSVLLPPVLEVAPTSPADVARWYESALGSTADTVAVPHSNAGLYVAPLRAAGLLAGSVYVDALVPPSSGDVAIAPDSFLAKLNGLADAEGMLPVWTEWWPDDDVGTLFASSASRQAVEAEQHRLPLAYFSSRLAVADSWDVAFPSAFLAFGGTYAEEHAEASRRGWPTRSMPGQHLHMLVDPVGVTDALEQLVEALALP